MDRFRTTARKLLNLRRISAEDITNNPFLMISIFLIASLFIGYAVYNYYNDEETIKVGYTYRSKDLTNSDVVFEYDEDNFDKCVSRCSRDISCDGITYDTERQLCVGSQDGILQPSDNIYISWKKTVKKVDSFVEKTVVVGYTNKEAVISGVVIPRPSMIDKFLFSFWINVTDWYENFEYWKHVWHKGNEIDKPLNYRQWDDIVTDFPDQFLGIWLAPFTNNLRICITTTGDMRATDIYQHANNQLCDGDKCIISDSVGGKYAHSHYKYQNGNDDLDNEDPSDVISVKQLEYYDIPNIPVNKLLFIAVNFHGRDMEIYIDGKLIKIIRLKGIPEYNGGNLYCKHDKSFRGGLYQLSYLPIHTPYKRIKDLYNEKPNISN